MKIVVIGGSGLIGSKLVALLRAGGHEVISASPASGVNTLTGEGLADGATVRLSPAEVQPIASDDVAAAMAHYSVGEPVNGIVEIAGPERLRLCDLVQRYLAATADPRPVVADVHARHFGAELQGDTLVPGAG
ncbi:hypothetical protein BH11PSE9_BH11PSE9_15770 [soil metagenome]